jgi:hypothetical protein
MSRQETQCTSVLFQSGDAQIDELVGAHPFALMGSVSGDKFLTTPFPVC